MNFFQHPEYSGVAAIADGGAEGGGGPSQVGRVSRRRAAGRIGVEKLAALAGYLPAPKRAVALAYWDLGMPLKEIALLHRVTLRTMRRRIERLRELMTDPAFLLAGKYADRLPSPHAEIARRYWLEGAPLRELAEDHGQTVYWARRELAEARTLLLMELQAEASQNGARTP